ncbi:MAG: hypothetical protein QXP04_03690 [Candidatus Nanoarchaeia archaeon]|nr:hypothetical protein [Candidatus Jingweiarchaeum tengchongense]
MADTLIESNKESVESSLLELKVKIAPFCHNNKILAAAPHVNKLHIATCKIPELFNSITLAAFTKETNNRLDDTILGKLSCYFQDNHLVNDTNGAYILNIYLAFFDWMIALKSAFLEIDYTRYIDSLCFSTNFKDSSKLNLMINLTKKELNRLNLKLDEIRIFSPKEPQVVFGIPVSDVKIPYEKPTMSEILKNMPDADNDPEVSMARSNNVELRSMNYISQGYKKTLMIL